MKKTLFKKVCSLFGFRSCYEHDKQYSWIKYKTFYWINKRFSLFSYVVKE